MDKFYENDLYQSTEKLSLKNHFEEYNNLVESTLHLYENEVISEQIANICDLNNLTCEGENTKIFPVDSPEEFKHLSKTKDFIKETCNLNVTKCKLEFTKQKLMYVSKQRKDFVYNNVLESKQMDLKPGQDYILSIQIFRPFFYRFFNNSNVGEQLKLSQELRILGRNTLADLKDCIHCISDEEICCEVENTNDLDLTDLPLAKDKYPSSFIFIENTFYNDFRSPEAIDYSDVLIKWANEHDVNLKKGANMESVCLHDLSIKLGYPYLYKHQGECEHILLISDAKLLQITDNLYTKSYPFIYKRFVSVLIQCNCCEVEYAKWIIKECNRFPRNIVYLCTKCCNSYNYVDGKKNGTFKLYPLLQKQ